MLATASGTWGELNPGPGRGEVKLGDATTLNETANLGMHTDRVFGVAFSPDGRSLATGGWDGSVLFWAVESPVPGPAAKPRGF